VDAANAQLLRHLLLTQPFQCCEAGRTVLGMMAQIAWKEIGGDSTCKWVTANQSLNNLIWRSFYCNIQVANIF